MKYLNTADEQKEKKKKIMYATIRTSFSGKLAMN